MNEKEKRTMGKNVFKKLGKKQKNNKGFSLVELIVVIAIMAVLVGVLAPQFIKYVERSRQSTDLQNVQELKSAIEADIADGEIAADVTITITGGANGTAVSDTTPAAAAATVKLKSSGWPTGTTDYVYSVSDGKWSTVPSLENTKEPKRNMDEVFK